MQAHGLGRVVHAPVRGRHDVLPQHRQNTGLQRDRQLVSLFRIRRQPGRIRHCFAGRSGARYPDNHGSVGTGIGHCHGGGNPRGAALGRPGLRDAGIHLAGGLCVPGHVRRGALCVRHGPFPCETKKLNEENNIRSPAGRYVGGNIVTLSRFVFI